MTKVIRAGAAMHAAVISISGSGGEHSLTRAEVARLHAALEQAREQHVTVVASSGDTGAISGQGPPHRPGRRPRGQASAAGAASIEKGCRLRWRAVGGCCQAGWTGKSW
jgi:hypothetical protein